MRLLDWMPVRASTFADQVDFMNNFISYVSAFCTLAIIGTMIFFAIKYRKRSDHDKTPQITHNTTLETLWTAIPTVVCIFVFYYGTMTYVEEREPPANSIEIGVRGYQWAWEFTYPTGKKVGADLYVPVNQPVKLIMISEETDPNKSSVSHGFFIPAMRVKEDVVGGSYHYLWFQAIKLGNFPIFCTQYCGMNHSGMMATLHVVSQEEYEDVINSRTKGELTPIEAGKAVFTNRGCVGCHSLDGSKMAGPTWKGLFGSDTALEDGTSVKADETYIKNSIEKPNFQIVKGFSPGIMPTIPLTNDETNQIIALIKSLK